MRRKGVTLREVAAAANVSRATAARALNSYGYVGDETALRVVEVANSLGYRANRVAQALRRGQLPIVGYLPGDIQTPFLRASPMTSKWSCASRATICSSPAARRASSGKRNCGELAGAECPRLYSGADLCNRQSAHRQAFTRGCSDRPDRSRRWKYIATASPSTTRAGHGRS